MSNAEYFSMQGRVIIGVRNADGTRKPGRWVYDASKLEWAMSANTDKKTESWSGSRGTAATLKTSKELKVNLTLGELNTDNAALIASGTRIDVATGTVTAEVVGDVAIGDYTALDFAATSDVVLTDDQAAVLVEGTDYTINVDTAVVTWLSANTGVTAAYSYAAHSIVTALNGNTPDYYVLFSGANTVDGTAKKVRGEVHRLSFDPGTLPFIQDSFGELDLSGEAKIDPVRQADPNWGGYARVIQIDPVS